MPNFCDNQLEITGNVADIRLFKTLVKDTCAGTDLSFDKLCPTPSLLFKFENFRILPSEYDWRVKHWGTKWDVKATLVNKDNKRIVYSFRSAWNPPLAWLKKAAQAFPSLQFNLSYKDEGENVGSSLIID